MTEEEIVIKQIKHHIELEKKMLELDEIDEFTPHFLKVLEYYMNPNDYENYIKNEYDI